jgi:hypothetical protein
VYAVLEQSMSDFRFEDIKVGCEFMVATLTKEWFKDIGKGNVSYDEIHELIVDGFEVSWLPAVCESRCGKGKNCNVVDEKSGEVQCGKRLCHYVYQTTDKCGMYSFFFLLVLIYFIVYNGYIN